MKKIEKASEFLWLFGMIFVAFGVSICNKANLGVSMIAAPAFVVSEAISSFWSGFSVGVTEYLIQGLMLLVLCLVVRRFNWRYLLAFAVAVLYGYILDFFLWIFSGISFDEVWLRWVMLLVGDAITALGVACFFRTYMPLQVYELFVAEIASCFRLNINKTKLCFDMAFLLISLILAVSLFGDVKTFDFSAILYVGFHNIGLGTLVTTVINSPLIAFMGKLIDRVFGTKPAFPKLEYFLKRDSAKN